MSIDESHLTTGSTSPFLPGTNIQFAWDSTSLGYIKTCPRLYQYIMIEGWSPKGESVHLRFGIEYHKALELYSNLRAMGENHENSVRAVVQAILINTQDFNPDRETKTGKYKNRDTLLSIVIDYLDHYIDDPCETYIMSNNEPATELSFRFELDWGPSGQDYGMHCDEEGNDIEFSPTQPYILSGHLDRVVTFNDHLFVMDHKTTTTTPGDYYFNQYEPNNQMTLYTLAGSLILHSPIRGVIIRAGQILLDKPNRFISGFTYRTPEQLDEWLTDLRIHLENAERYATTNYWPTNDTACDKYGGCKFREVCSKDPGVREMFLKADFVKLEREDRWNPLRSR